MASVLVGSAADTSSLNLTLIHVQRLSATGATHSLLADHYSTELAFTHTLLLQALTELVSLVSGHVQSPSH